MMVTAAHPTLSLLSTPWEYFVTIDQSALWQKHIAWAKPKGSDLKAYISSQYSSRMVLLSLLLATEMSVFFNSSPKMVNLRHTLNIWDATNVESIPFWIGFVLLLNICVTISGILATFATWNVVSAISDANAHCLLRSSLGQYVATLSPRLVVASLYLFLLWFLLFVVELLFGGANSQKTTRTLHELLTQHLHLVILWGSFLMAVVILFFSIVVPLSAFGRLVLHTGAMAEQPVLSEALQVELLPRGLHVGLVIKAHHSQKRGMAVTRQYQQRNKNRTRVQHQNTTGETECEEEAHQQQEEQQQQQLEEADQCRPSSSRVAITDDLHNLSNGHAHEEAPEIGNEDATDSSVVLTRFGVASASYESSQKSTTSSVRSGCDDGDKTINRGSMEQQSNSIHTNKYHNNKNSHRRMNTTETLASVNLPPASILNLAMTAKEFHEVIDSAMDTSSLYSCGSDGNDPMDEKPDLAAQAIFESGDERRKASDGSREGGLYNNSEPKSSFRDKDNVFSEAFVSAYGEQYSRSRSSNHASGIPLSPYSPPAQSPDGGRPTRYRSSNNHQELVTRHHRRVSSSRFLLEEWAQENRVRDLYGAAPPADLPHEIAYMFEEVNQSSGSQRKEYPLLTPHPSSTNQDPNTNNSLSKPLLPNLDASRDEELGAGESSELLGEHLLVSEGDRNQNTSVSWKPRKIERRAQDKR